MHGVRRFSRETKKNSERIRHMFLVILYNCTTCSFEIDDDSGVAFEIKMDHAAIIHWIAEKMSAELRLPYVP